MTITTEENPIRSALVRDTINANPETACTVDSLSPLFPEGFELGEDDLERYAAEAPEAATDPIEFEGAASEAPHVPGESIGEIKVTTATAQKQRANEAAAKAEAVALPSPEEIERAVERCSRANHDLANARVVVIAAGNLEREARAELASAVSAFQNGFAVVTPQELRTQFVKEQTEIRRKIASGEMPRPKTYHGIGKSAIDRTAFYQRGGSAAGGGRAYARGALPASAFGRSVAPKVPSQG